MMDQELRAYVTLAEGQSSMLNPYVGHLELPVTSAPENRTPSPTNLSYLHPLHTNKHIHIILNKINILTLIFYFSQLQKSCLIVRFCFTRILNMF